MLPLYCCWPTCSCQQYKTVECCHGNATMRSICTAAQSVLPDSIVGFTQILSFSTDYRPPYQISPKSVLIHAMGQTDGHKDANRSCQRLTRTRQKNLQIRQFTKLSHPTSMLKLADRFSRNSVWTLRGHPTILTVNFLQSFVATWRKRVLVKRQWTVMPLILVLKWRIAVNYTTVCKVV
jgi:hypothetical protein